MSDCTGPVCACSNCGQVGTPFSVRIAAASKIRPIGTHLLAERPLGIGHVGRSFERDAAQIEQILKLAEMAGTIGKLIGGATTERASVSAISYSKVGEYFAMIRLVS